MNGRADLDEVVGQLIDALIEDEGGYVNHPDDRGGATKFGITLNTLGLHRGREVSEADVEYLTRAEAVDIYEEMYIWDGLMLFPKELIQAVFTATVMSGKKTAVRLFQASVNELLEGWAPELLVDGLFGPNTKHYVLHLFGGKEYELQTLFIDNMVRNFVRIVLSNPTQVAFLKGWVNRVLKMRTFEEGED